MFQTFDASTRPDQGPPRLAALRNLMQTQGVDGFIVPRSDRFMGEYVAPCDERLAWLTGFTGSAGFAAVLADTAGVFVDGRYRVQVTQQVDPVFTPLHWPETLLQDWLVDAVPPGAVIAFDPWLHPIKQIAELRSAVDGHASLRPSANLVDQIWQDRPTPPNAQAFVQPFELTGTKSRAKCAQIADGITAEAVLMTQPDSLCWLLNIRGADIPRNPVVHAWGILHRDGSVQLFSQPGKFDDLGPDPTIQTLGWDDLGPALTALQTLQLDPATCPEQVLSMTQAKIQHAADPCALPKARKTKAELIGARRAHDRDAVAMVEFLAWLDAQTPGTFTEIDVVTALEGFRAKSDTLRDISFETIAGTGANAAIVHYRVTQDTNAIVQDGQLLLVDSGAQYQDGTTDITRTIAIGPPGTDARTAYTRVLQGMIAISQAQFPRGLAGRDLDALARAPLWKAGQDYDHGTGHGVGSYLCVHEGPQSLSRRSEVPLEPGMILSNEPGYYRQGAFGIRIENLIAVQTADTLPGGDGRDMLSFETLTHVPFDRRLIVSEMLSPDERTWINAYHAALLPRLKGRLSEGATTWLGLATAPLT